MISHGFSKVVRPSPGPRFILRATRLLSLLVLALLTATAAAAPDETARGTAMVAVVADLLSGSPDKVSIRLVGRDNKELLTAIAAQLGEKFHATPAQLTFQRGDPVFIEQEDLGAEFLLPVVPRGGDILPIGPFIEVFAPHAAQLRIVFVVRGPFTYRGYHHFDHPDVSITVDPPENSAPNQPIPLAFYGVNVTIRNPSLTSLPQPPSSEDEPAPRRGRTALYLWLLAAVAGGVSAGVLLSRILLRWKAAVADQERTTSTGGDHDRTRNE